MKNFFQKNWIHFVLIFIMIIITVLYFKPQFDGMGLKQHDIQQWKGMSQEIESYRERTGEQTLWTNSMFGGMPTTQISTVYDGNAVKGITNFYFKNINAPAGIVLMYMIGFYILMLCLRINPLVGFLGSVLFAFSSYDIIIIQAGHLTKAIALSFLAPTLGAFILAYKRNMLWGILLSALFMAMQLAANHVQVTYYFAFLLIFVGIVFLVQAIIKSELKRFLLTSGGILAAYLVALLINFGNIALTSDYAKNTIRGGNDITINPDGTTVTNSSSTGLNKDYITQWSYGIGETFTLLSPNVKGGGSFALGGSQFEEIPQNMDLETREIQSVMRYPAYWGEQPFTSGPVYVGMIAIFLAIMGMVYIRKPIKWALFTATILAIMLSWGKNFMGFTDFFIDYVPGYNKFRTVTIILVIAELCIPILAVLFLNLIVKEREIISENKMKFFITSGSIILFLILLTFTGLGDNYASKQDMARIESVNEDIYNQLLQIPPAQLMEQYRLDINNKDQVAEFINQQAEVYTKDLQVLKDVRKQIFTQSMLRSILFSVLALGCLMLFFVATVPAAVPVILLIILGMIDVIGVSSNYLNSEEDERGYVYWEDKALTQYPFSMSAADQTILDYELNRNPSLAPKIQKATEKGKMIASEMEVTGVARQRVIDAYKMAELNFNTNYRVFDFSGGFSSSAPSYFHKSLGGYHGAKLRNIQNVFDFHIANSNNKVLDMMNVRYFIQRGQDGNPNVRENPTALGNAWFVKAIETVKSPNDEIRSLGKRFQLKNSGNGQLLVNGEPKSEVIVYGTEQVQYLPEGGDSVKVPFYNGIPVGMQTYFVADVNGQTNAIPAQELDKDTVNSFTKYALIEVISDFNPEEKAVMLQSEGEKLRRKTFSGNGEIKMTSYAPNKLVYEVNINEPQFAVFSEVYYPEGWKAFVDGKEVPILKTNYFLRGVELKTGDRKVEFVFDLPKYHTANTVSYIFSIILLVTILIYAFIQIRAARKIK